MALEVKSIAAPAKDAAVSEWENRRLCSDESCIGVIGSDGRCKECGRPGDPAGLSVEEPTEVQPAVEPTAQSSESDTPIASDDEWENRRLCNDENCIGVIGADGRCKECGKPYAV
jgi:hypothetical protein